MRLSSIAKAVDLQAGHVSNWAWIEPRAVAKCPDEQFGTGLLELADKSHRHDQRDRTGYMARGWMYDCVWEEAKALAA